MDGSVNIENIECKSTEYEKLSRSCLSAPAGTGYGISAFLSPKLISCRLYDLSANKLIAMRRIPGDFEVLSGAALKKIATELIDEMSAETGIPLSKFNVAVISGTTAMESKFAGTQSNNLDTASGTCLGEFGCDIEYILAGTNSIAVGNAFFVPCINEQIGGDFLCSLLAIDILCADKPKLFVSLEPSQLDNGMGLALALGNKDTLTACAVPAKTSASEAIVRFLEICRAEHDAIECTLFAGVKDADLPDDLRKRAQCVSEAAIEGASAILMSDSAEDELCRIVSACQIVNL